MKITKSFRLKGILTALYIAFLLLSGIDLVLAQKNVFLAGSEKINITPQVPLPMSGYGSRKGPFKGVHDDIYARVIVLSDGINKAALISAEVIGFSNSFWEECTRLITLETGIPKEYILLTAVHNHSGPDVGTYSRDETPEVMAYVNELRMNLVKATKAAVNNLSPAAIGAGKGECRMNINRVAADGKGGIALGRNPYGPCDHEVGILRIDRPLGNPIALMVNWPCHAVVLGPRNYFISGDWPGAASGYIEERLGKTAIAPIIVGASGDINPIYGPHIDFEFTNSYAFGKDAIGEDLGKEAIRVAEKIKTATFGEISAQQRVISLKLKDDVKEANKFQQPDNVSNDSLKVRLSAIKIGNIVLTGVSGEVFNQISVKLRDLSPYTHTFMITHCNGSSGYLVTDEAYITGGYESKSTKVKSGAEKAIIENLLEIINDL